MQQTSYGTLTITDTTDIARIQNWYLASSSSSGVQKTDSGWTTDVTNTNATMTATKQYLWSYEQVQGEGANGNYITISTTDPVIIGRYGQNGGTGAAGRGITSIDEYYQVTNSTTNPDSSGWQKNTLVTPTSTNPYLWNYQVINYTSGNPQGTYSDARIIGVYGDTGISVTSTKTYYMLAVNKPSKPTDNAAIPSGWLSTQPTFDSSKLTYKLYTVIQIIYSNNNIIYSEVQTDSSFEAAKVAYQKAQSAETSANEKSAIYYQTSPPSGGTYKNGDTWFDTDNDNKIYNWNETTSQWEAAQLGADAIANLAITNAKIANGTIQDAKIGNLNGGKIIAGTIDVGSIDAQSGTFNVANIPTLTSEKITIGSTTTTLTSKLSTVDTAISNAAKIASNYIVGDSTGIMIADMTNGVATSSTVLGKNVLIDSDSLDIRDGQTILATFGADGAQIGQNSKAHSIIDANGQRFYATNGTTQLANIGYGVGIDQNGSTTTTSFPYYTFGIRYGASIGTYSFAEGHLTTASGSDSHAEGYLTTASGYASHVEGGSTTASKSYSHAEGDNTTASGTRSHAEGYLTTASGNNSHAEGRSTMASGSSSHAEGDGTIASNAYSHAEGYETTASGSSSHTEGNYTTASGWSSHAEGGAPTTSASEGEEIILTGDADATTYTVTPPFPMTLSHLIGLSISGMSIRKIIDVNNTSITLDGTLSHSAVTNLRYRLYVGTSAIGRNSHTEGALTSAYGEGAHAEGILTDASGDFSHTGGYGTIAASQYQTAIGKYNIEDANNTYSFIIGNGTSSATRSNAASLDWSGNAVLAGELTVGGDISATGDLSVTGDATITGALTTDSVATGSDIDWTELTLDSACTAYSSVTTPHYKRRGDLVTLIGDVKPTAEVAAGGTMTIGQLPTECYPAQRVCFLCQGSGRASWLCTIDTTGVITAARYRTEAGNQAMTTSTWLPFAITYMV